MNKHFLLSLCFALMLSLPNLVFAQSSFSNDYDLGQGPNDEIVGHTFSSFAGSSGGVIEVGGVINREDGITVPFVLNLDESGGVISEHVADDIGLKKVIKIKRTPMNDFLILEHQLYTSYEKPVVYRMNSSADIVVLGVLEEQMWAESILPTAQNGFIVMGSTNNNTFYGDGVISQYDSGYQRTWSVDLSSVVNGNKNALTIMDGIRKANGNFVFIGYLSAVTPAIEIDLVMLEVSPVGDLVNVVYHEAKSTSFTWQSFFPHGLIESTLGKILVVGTYLDITVTGNYVPEGGYRTAPFLVTMNPDFSIFKAKLGKLSNTQTTYYTELSETSDGLFLGAMNILPNNQGKSTSYIALFNQKQAIYAAEPVANVTVEKVLESSEGQKVYMGQKGQKLRVGSLSF